MMKNMIKRLLVFVVTILFFATISISGLNYNDNISNKAKIETSSINSNETKTYDLISNNLYFNDTTPPVIIDNTPRVGYTGDKLGFDAIVYDEDENVSSVWVEFWYDDGQHTNLSMIKISCEIYYIDIVINHTLDPLHYFISANDTSNNWNKTNVTQIQILDNDLPIIKNITAEPQFVYYEGFVNISVKVYDNILLNDVYLSIIYPDLTVENISIYQNWTGLKYYCKKYYDIIGLYTFNIYAFDSSGNLNKSKNNTFVVIGDPDLDCYGNLNWEDIEPGSTISDIIYVENIGGPYSLLNWEIISYPNWGTWTFIPPNGDDLKPEDGPFFINVKMIAPNEEESEFTGEIIFVNSEDLNDTCTIEVTLKTPLNQQIISFNKVQIFNKQSVLD